jgi:hypothetical protein
MTDIWVCGTCHSINRQRNAKCYKCGAKQDMSATGPLADLRTERAIVQRGAKPYRSSLIFAIIASAFILLVAALGLIVLNESIAAYRFLRDQLPAIVGGSFTEQELAVALLPTAVPAMVSTLVAVIALFAFALWLSRIVANIPALGGGAPSVSSTRAFFAPFIPIYNLIKVPPIIQEAMYRTDPRAGGFFMIALAWVGLVGSAIVGYVADRWLALRIDSIFFNATSMGQLIDELTAAFDLAIIVDIVTTLMISVGAVILVMIMLRIESRARARDREIRKGSRAMAEAQASELEDDLARQRALAAEQAAGPVSAGFVAPDTGEVATPFALPVAATAPAAGAAVAATALGTAPGGDAGSAAAGPRLRLIVAGGAITGSLDGDVDEAVTLDELRLAAPALADAAGSATVVIADASDDAAAELAGEVVTVMRGAGVPTTLA